MFNLRTYCLCDACGAYDWTIASGNDCTALTAGVGIGGAGVQIGIGVGGITLVFLLILALPCPILGLGVRMV